jgi:hypothetical protein
MKQKIIKDVRHKVPTHSVLESHCDPPHSPDFALGDRTYETDKIFAIIDMSLKATTGKEMTR